jgi:hypothetical protein
MSSLTESVRDSCSNTTGLMENTHNSQKEPNLKRTFGFTITLITVSGTRSVLFEQSRRGEGVSPWFGAYSYFAKTFSVGFLGLRFFSPIPFL